jgi:hypothetical protein
MTSISLAEFDIAPPAETDPSIWSGNLAALKDADAALAARIADAPIPPDWRPAVALDESLSYRVEADGAPPAWLGATAIPSRRAATVIDEYECGDLNATLPAIGAGAELSLLLQRLPAHKAVYAFAESPAHIVAALRLHDLSRDLNLGRCILLPPGDEPGAIDRLLEAHPGLLPPGNILCPPGVPAERTRQIQRLCIETAERWGRIRTERVAELHREYGDADRPRDVNRLAVLALSTDPVAHRTAQQLAGGWQELGRAAICRTIAGPRDVHLLAHCRAMTDFRPGLTICVNHARANLPLPAVEAACEWRLDADSPAGRGEGAVALAATPTLLEVMERERGAGKSTTLPFYFGCDSEAREAAQNADGVALVADLPDDAPAANGVVQPTHEMIWNAARELARRNWESGAVARPHTLLKQAERAAGVELSDAALRERMVRLIERTLIPAAVLERILQTLRQESIPLTLIGTGWKRLSEPTTATATAESVSDFAQREGGSAPLAWLFAGRPDPLHPDLPAAGATGRPLLLHALGGQSPAPALRDLLTPERHFAVFCCAAELRKLVASLRERPQRWNELGRRTRAHLLAEHTCGHRLRDLTAALERSVSRVGAK